ncbi:MAG: hypothetical protein ACYC0F_10150 [Rhodanobacter sp.]
MHLGRFHAVINDLALHFRAAKLVPKLEKASELLELYGSNRNQTDIDAFKSLIGQIRDAAEINDRDLDQPYAQQIIDELDIREILNPDFSRKINEIISRASFDPHGLAQELKSVAEEFSTKIQQVLSIDSSFDKLGVEFQRVAEDESEIGFLLPKEVVGETLANLSKEFDDLSKLARAVNELSGDSEEYDPRVITISSSWWQIFLDLTPEQIGIWIIAIERIVNLFKSNLEIKNLARQLREQNMPDKITKQIEDEVDKRVRAEIERIAKDIRKQHSKGKDPARANELETQLRHGLVYLAKRLNQGVQVEINIGIPSEPKMPESEEGQELDKALVKEIEQRKARILNLRELRERARTISVETENIGKDSPLLISSEPDNEEN